MSAVSTPTPTTRATSQDHPEDRTAGFRRLIPPSLQQLQQGCRIGIQLLQWPPLDVGNNPDRHLARLAHLQYSHQRIVLLKRRESSAQVIHLDHGASSSALHVDDDARPRRRPHSFSVSSSIRRCAAKPIISRRNVASELSICFAA
jgi:hypothetical protein